MQSEAKEELFGVKLSREKAIEEVNEWLDSKRVRPSVRKDNEEAINGMIECFELGIFARDPETNVITQFLEPGGALQKLEFKPRLTAEEFSKYNRNVKSGDSQGFINAKIACLTGQNTKLIEKLDHEDAKVSHYIVIFFL